MRTLKVISSALVLTLVVLCTLPTALEINAQTLVFIFCTTGIVLCTAIILLRNSIVIHPVDFLVLLLLIYIIIHYCTIGGSFTSTNFIHITYLFFLYFGLKIVTTSSPGIKRLVLFAIFLCGIYEASVGILQQINVLEAKSEYFSVLGSFYNPGIYAGYIAVIGSVALAVVLGNYSRIKRLILTRTSKLSGKNKALLIFYLFATISATLILIILPFTKSRGAWLAFFISFCSYMLIDKNIRHRLIRLLRTKTFLSFILFASLLVAVTFAFIGAYQIKRPSANGRILIWKVSSHIVKEHLLTGIGIGNFAGEYGKYQAEYLKIKSDNDKESLLAGSPDSAFNDYLTITTEIGILGLLIIFAILYIVLYQGIKHHSYFSFGIIAWLVFALTSYPSSVLPMQIILIICCVMIQSRRMKFSNVVAVKKGTGIIASLIMLTVAAYLTFQYVVRERATSLWQRALQADDISTAKKLYYMKKCVKFIDDNPHFLFDYGFLLSSDSQFGLSNEILEKGSAMSSDPTFYIVMGDNFSSLGDYELSEQNYLIASEMIPSRLLPNYKLWQLYVKQGELEKAIKAAEKAISQPLKVENNFTRYTKNEMKEFLESAGNLL